MSTITFEVKHLIGFEMSMVEYPTLTSKVKWVRKGISVLERRWPGLLRYLSRQQVLARLSHYPVILRVHGDRSRSSVSRAFALWMRKERVKNLLFMIIEALIIPFTGFLAMLPGPNVFFYVPGLLLYFHYTAWRGLKRAEKAELDVRVEYVDKNRQEASSQWRGAGRQS
jgi:hypothetical protein